MDGETGFKFFADGGGGGRLGRAESGSQSDDKRASRRTFETFCRCLSTASATSPEYLLISFGTEESYASVSKGMHWMGCCMRGILQHQERFGRLQAWWRLKVKLMKLL